MRHVIALLLPVLCGWSPAAAQSESWTQPVEPFRVAGNLYFVGTRGLSSFLFVTSEGAILLDTGIEETVPMIAENIEKLGFRVSDVEVILSSHAHFDHVGGHAAMRERTGAIVLAVGEDATALASGRDTSALNGPGWTPVEVGRVLQDGDTVSLGGTTLTAHLTPGHTKGCTTWTTTVDEGGKRYSVVLVGGTSVNAGVRLKGNVRHPGIAADYARTFEKLRSFTPDIFLAQHPTMFRMEEKLRRLHAKEAGNPFVDPDGYRGFVETNERAYRTQLERER